MGPLRRSDVIAMFNLICFSIFVLLKPDIFADLILIYADFAYTVSFGPEMSSQ